MWKVVPYMRIEVEDPELYQDMIEAEDVKEHLESLHPENYYELEEVD